MMHEYVAGLKPLRHFFYISSLLVSCESAETEEMRTWILGMLNDLEGRSSEAGDLWTEDAVMVRSLAATGRIG
jgi:hypothetical protein